MCHMLNPNWNKHQHELFEEMMMKLNDLEKEEEPRPKGMARLDGPLKNKRRKIELEYIKKIKEAAD